MSLTFPPTRVGLALPNFSQLFVHFWCYVLEGVQSRVKERCTTSKDTLTSQVETSSGHIRFQVESQHLKEAVSAANSNHLRRSCLLLVNWSSFWIPSLISFDALPSLKSWWWKNKNCILHIWKAECKSIKVYAFASMSWVGMCKSIGRVGMCRDCRRQMPGHFGQNMPHALRGENALFSR